jgi:hypothetical protein
MALLQEGVEVRSMPDMEKDSYIVRSENFCEIFSPKGTEGSYRAKSS